LIYLVLKIDSRKGAKADRFYKINVKKFNSYNLFVVIYLVLKIDSRKGAKTQRFYKININ